MVLCQVIVRNAQPQLYQIGIYGRKKVRLCRLDYRYDAAPGDDPNQALYLHSDILRLPFGNFPYFAFMPVSAYQVSNIHSDMEFVCDFNGNLDIAVRRVTDNAVTTILGILILTLDISDVE